MAKIGTIHVEVKPVLNQAALAEITETLDALEERLAGVVGATSSDVDHRQRATLRGFLERVRSDARDAIESGAHLNPRALFNLVDDVLVADGRAS